jgi:phage terminase small subunit
MSALTDPKEETFARIVGSGRSKRDAAIAAGHNKKDASSYGGKLARKPRIAARIAELQQITAELALEGAQISRDLVLAEFRKLAFLDIRKAFTKDGDLRPITEFDDATAAAVAGLEFEEVFVGRGPGRAHVGRIHKLKFVDKKGALDSIAKHLGMFIERQELTGKDGGPIQITITPTEAEL